MCKILNIFFAIFILMTSTANAEILDSDKKQILDNELSAMIGDDSAEKVPGLGVIAFKDGEKIYSGFFGQRNIEKNLPVTQDTRFRVASLSKMFTMFGIMKLVEQGKIDLDEDVSKYLGFKLRNPNFPDEKITVRMLASHTSTLRDGDSYALPPKYNLKEFFRTGGIAYHDGIHFSKKDKSYFTYCNLNYGVLGTIIEKVSGERFDKFMKKNILRPMKIKADYVTGNFGKNEFKNLGAVYQKKNDETWDENAKFAAQADNYKDKPKKDFVTVRTPYDKKENYNYSLKDYKIGSNATVFSPASGLRISFEELANTLEMLMNDGNFHGKKIIRKDLIEEMCKPQWIYDEKIKNGNTYEVMFKYGLGLYMIDGAGDARLCKDYEIDLIGHSGDAYGMISGLYFTPDKKNGAIFMINGTAVESGVNEKSFGKFSNGFIWEENIMNPICQYIFVDK